MTVVEQTAAPVHREGSEVGTRSVIDDPAAVGHGCIPGTPGQERNRLRGTSPRFKKLGHPPRAHSGQFIVCWQPLLGRTPPRLARAGRGGVFQYAKLSKSRGWPARVLRRGHWPLVIGRWSVVSGQWSVVSGQWLVVGGQWSFVIRHWSVVGVEGGVAGGKEGSGWGATLVNGEWNLPNSGLEGGGGTERQRTGRHRRSIPLPQTAHARLPKGYTERQRSERQRVGISWQLGFSRSCATRGFCTAFACCAKSWATGSGASGCGWGVCGFRLERKVAPAIGGMAQNSL